jgi:flagellar hook-associated protein 3 FlgL
MSLRTPNPLTNSQILLDLQRSKEHSAVLSEQISSGNRIVRLADDPTGAALILDFQTSISRNEQYVKQANSAGNFLQSSETAMSSLNESLTRLVELGTQGLGTSTGVSGRTALAQEVDGIRNNILSLSNTKSAGKYIFAGTRTTTQPFSGPSAGAILYAGDSSSIDLAVSDSTTVSTNLTGDQVFFGGPAGPTGQGVPPSADLFQQVLDLSNALKANNTANIQTAYDNIRTIQTRLNTQITDLGGRQAGLDQLKLDLGAYNASLKSIQSTYQTVDYPEAITEYTREQTAQEATLSILAKGSQLNLFDYLG